MTTGSGLPDIVCIGMQGALSKWLFDFVLEAGARGHASGLVDTRWVGLDDDVMDVGKQSASRRQLVATNEPGNQLIEAVQRYRLSTILSIEDALDAIVYQRRIGVASTWDALRPLTCAAAMVQSLAANSNTLIISRKPDINAREQAHAILAHMALGLTPVSEAVVLEEFCGPQVEAWSLETALSHHCELYARPVRDKLTPPEDPQSVAVMLAIDPLIKMALNETPTPIVWNSELFFDETTHEPIGLAMIDLAGPPRSLAHGPFLHFPLGQYRIAVTLDVAPNAIDAPLSLEFYWGNSGEGLICGRTIEPEHAGLQTGHFDVTLDQPGQVLDVRLKVHEPMIEGHVALHSIEFFLIDG